MSSCSQLLVKGTQCQIKPIKDGNVYVVLYFMVMV